MPYCCKHFQAMGTENKQKRKERNLRYQMRKKGYQFNR